MCFQSQIIDDDDYGQALMKAAANGSAMESDNWAIPAIRRMRRVVESSSGRLSCRSGINYTLTR